MPTNPNETALRLSYDIERIDAEIARVDAAIAARSCPDASASPASLPPDTTPLATVSAVAGAETSAQGYAVQFGGSEPFTVGRRGIAKLAEAQEYQAHIDCISYGDEECLTCNGMGRVCSWCYHATREDGACDECGSTEKHRKTWATHALWLAAYDPSTWEGVARRARDLADQLQRDLHVSRSIVSSLRGDVAKARDEAHQTRKMAEQAVERANRERYEETEDLKRQLRKAGETIRSLRAGRAA